MGPELGQDLSSARHCPLCDERYDEGERCPVDGTTLIRDDEDPLIGEVLGGCYRVEGLLGVGGGGRVYRGYQLSLERPVAIKVLLEHRLDAKSMRRFLIEARGSSRLDHPNIVRVIDADNTADKRCYLVMELIEGENLDAYVPADGLSFALVKDIFAQLCAGVEASHRAGLIHRDLKPRNAMILEREDGTRLVKILDFGLAKQLDPEDTGLTAEGEFLGTPGFMAPEQMSGGAVDARTDVYALGAMLYFLLTGQRPFAGESGAAIVMNQLEDRSKDLRPGSSDAPPAIAAVIRKALQREPAGRYPDVRTLAAAVAADGRGELSAPPTPTLPAEAEPREPASPWSRRALFGGILVTAATAAGLYFAIGRRAPLELAMSGALTGPAGAVGQAMAMGLRARIAQANARKELRRELRLELADDGYEAERALANVERLAPTTLAFVGNVGTPTTAACLPAVLAARVPLLGAHSGAEHLRREPPDRYVFNFRAGYARETAALVEHVLQRQRRAPEAIAVFAQDDAFGDSGIEGIRRALARSGFLDFERVLKTRYRANTMDVREAVEALAGRASAEVIVLVAAYRAAAQCVASLAPRRPDLSFTAISPAGGQVLADELLRLGQNPQGLLSTQVVPDPLGGGSGLLRYREALAALDPAATPGPVSLEGFIVADLLIEALGRSEELGDSEALVAALESFDEVDLGFGAALSYSPSDHQGCERIWASRANADGRFVEIQLG